MTETTVIPQGALARFTVDTPDLSLDPWGKVRTYPAGEIFEVEEFISAQESEDGVAFYYGSLNGGVNNVAAPADAVELYKARADVSRVPSAEDLLDALGSAVLTDGHGFTIDETERDGVHSLLAYGRTGDGFRFGVRISLSDITPTDF